MGRGRTERVLGKTIGMDGDGASRQELETFVLFLRHVQNMTYTSLADLDGIHYIDQAG